MSRSRFSIIGATLFATFLLAACGESTIDSDDLSGKVKAGLQPNLSKRGVKLQSVDCPDVKAEVGETFTCDGTTPNGSELKIDGEVTAYDSDSGQYSASFEVVSVARPDPT